MKTPIFITITAVLMLSINVAWAQIDSDKYNKYFSKDQLSFSLSATHWLKSNDAPAPNLFSRGVNFQMMYPIIGEKSNAALAMGFGLACQNYFLDNYLFTNPDSLWFVAIPDTINYTKYKINTNYLTLPIEFRIRTNPSKETRRSFKIYTGFRAGILINVHTKYIGTNLENGEKIKEKRFDLNHIAKFNYGITFRIGYGKFLFHSYYSLTQLIDPNKGPKITPVELGVTLILF